MNSYVIVLNNVFEMKKNNPSKNLMKAGQNLILTGHTGLIRTRRFLDAK